MTQLAILQLELHIPQAQSLKDKRRVVKSLKDRLSAHVNVSVAEVDFLDKWQRAGLAITMVSAEKSHLESQFAHIQRFTEQEIQGWALITQRDLQFL